MSDGIFAEYHSVEGLEKQTCSSYQVLKAFFGPLTALHALS
jgi:hypothetical protein